MQASQYYLKLVRFMDSCKDEEMLEVLGKITNITFVDAQIDFDISLGFNTRGCRVVEDSEEKCVYEIQNNKLYIRPEQKNDNLDSVQDIEDKYKQKFYDYIQEELEWKEKQELEWEQEEAILEEELRYHEYMREQQEKSEDSEYTTEKVIDEGKVGHWSDDDDDDE
jgi:flagellar motility protein MotE (MotC chaperone)